MSNNAKYTYPDLLWAGSEHSLDLAIAADKRMNGFLQDAPAQAQDENNSYLLSKQDGIGVISIRGPLVNRDSPWNQLLGVTSYAEIRRALVQAANDTEIKGVLLDIDSGGGAVNGVADTGDLIKTIDRQVKPIWSYTEGTMASAAYWLGSSARQVFASKTSITGSIGVILTHIEYSKMLKDEGIGVTVMRAGEYKALANAVEPLSEVAQRQIQDQLNSAYGVFINHVADARGTTENLADQRMGQGREFFGEQAVVAGLVDGIASFDTVMSRFSTKLLDNSDVTLSNSGQYQRGHDMTKRALTEKQLAALAAGANPAAAVETTTETAAAEEKPATETPAASVASPEDAATTAAATEPPAPASTGSDPVVAYLQQQLAASQDQIVELRLQVTRANDTITAMKATHDGLMAIATRSLSNMKVALGLPAVEATLSPETLLAEHTATVETFQKAFKAGGVAAVNTETKPAALLDPHLKRRIQATRLSTN